MPSVDPSGFASFAPGGPTLYTDNSDGPPIGLFVFLFVVVALVGVGMTIYRVTTARRIAEENGLDGGDAARVALLNDNAVTATYLAGSIQARRQATAPAVPVKSVKMRLDELRQLHDAGEISDEEYASGRQHIINGA